MPYSGSLGLIHLITQTLYLLINIFPFTSSPLLTIHASMEKKYFLRTEKAQTMKGKKNLHWTHQNSKTSVL